MPDSKTRPKALFVGLATIDINYTVEAIPRRDQKISVPNQLVTAGGPATNAAVTFAFLGGRSELVTAVGSHPVASVIREDLRQHAVRLHDIAPHRKEVPPVSSILVVRGTGERTVVSANAAVFSDVGGELNPSCVRRASILLVDGHYMPLCISAARLAHERGIPVVLDSGSWKPRMGELLPYVDVVICSANFRPPGCKRIDDVFAFLRAQKIRQIAITRSASAMRFLDNGRRGRIDVQNVRAVDTLGAGDIFHGAFCFYYVRSSGSFRESLSKAAEVAGFSCCYRGTRSWMAKFHSPGSKR